MPEERKKVVALLSDLLFTVKIQEAAKQAGVDAVFISSEQDAVTQAQRKPAVMILDLNNPKLDPLHVIEQLKKNQETSTVRLLGYVSHVQADLKRAAEKRGCDKVIPRSAFSQNLSAILRQYTEEIQQPLGIP